MSAKHRPTFICIYLGPIIPKWLKESLTKSLGISSGIGISLMETEKVRDARKKMRKAGATLLNTHAYANEVDQKMHHRYFAH